MHLLIQTDRCVYMTTSLLFLYLRLKRLTLLVKDCLKLENEIFVACCAVHASATGSWLMVQKQTTKTAPALKRITFTALAHSRRNSVINEIKKQTINVQLKGQVKSMDTNGAMVLK